MDTYFQHYRIPEGYIDEGRLNELGNRAKPPRTIMFRYSPHHSEFIDSSFRSSRHTPLVRGGMTRCIIVEEDGTEYVGEAVCSLLDNFCYRIGREIAHGRARSKMKKGEPDLWPAAEQV